jgi:predicted TIM-barrel fold metal-dependent hydrolase
MSSSPDSRRSFLRKSAVGLMAASLVRRAAAEPGDGPEAPAAALAGPAPTVLVDWHSHIVTPGELKFLAGRSKPPRVATNAEGQPIFENATTVSAAAGPGRPAKPSDLDSRLKHLAANNVRRQLLTYTVANGYEATLPVEEQRAFYRILNDDLAETLRRHPGKFLGVAAVPTLDPQWGAQELARAHQELGLIGVALPLNIFATLESARTQAPLFAAAQKFQSHVFVHRAPASPTLPGQPPLIVPTDLGPLRWGVISNTHLVNGALTLGLTDFLDPYPDVTVQVIMLGGFLPYLIDTVVSSGRRIGVSDPLAKLRRIYLEPGPYSSTNPEWVAVAAEKFGADRILFGTDYGVGGGVSPDRLAPSIAALSRVLSKGDQDKLFVENSRRLLAARGLA